MKCMVNGATTPCGGRQMFIPNYFLVKRKDGDQNYYVCERHTRLNPFLDWQHYKTTKKEFQE